MSTTVINFTIKDLDGAVVPLTRFRITSGRPSSGAIPVEVPYQVEFVTNADGQAQVSLEASTTIPYYISKVDGATEQIIAYKFFVVASTTTLEAELLYVDLGMRNAKFNEKSVAALIEAKIVAINAANQALQVVSLLGDVSTIRTNLASLVTVGSNIANVNTVATNIASVNSVASNVTNINAVANNVADIDAVVPHLTNIDTVAGKVANIDIVAPHVTNIDTVATNVSKVDTVATNVANIGTVASNITNVNLVGNNVSNVNSVASNLSQVNTVASDIDAVKQTAQGIGSIPTVMPYVSNIATVAANITPIVAVGNNIDNINEVRTMEAEIDVVAVNVGNLAGAAAAVTQAVDARKELFIAGTDYTFGVSTYLELDYFPAKSNSVKVFFNGIYQNSNTWTRVGKTLSFNSPIDATQVEVHYEVPSSFVGLSPEDILVIQNAEAAAIAAKVDAQQSAAASAVSASNALAAATQAVDGKKELYVAGVQYTKGVSTQLTLGDTPAKTNTIKVFFNGLYQHSDTYTRVGTLLTFNQPINVDQVEIQYEVPSSFVGLTADENAILVAAQNAAQASANAAAQSFDSFDDRYLGAKASAPTVDNDGNALIVGAKYFNSIENRMYVRNSSNAWQAVDDAASINYLPAGTGAVPTTVEQQLKNIQSWTVNVKDAPFYAKGDGVTDDTAAIQAAVTHCLTNNIALDWPDGIYLCGALTATSNGNLIWYANGNVKLRCVGTDVTLISPTGNVSCTGLLFDGYMVGFNFANIDVDKVVSFKDCKVVDCGTTATAAGRVDWQGFITNKNLTSNKIARLEVVNCNFVGDDFCVCWQGKFKFALVTGCSFKTVRRMAVYLGVFGEVGSGRFAYDCENIIVTNNTFQDIIGNDASEYEIHAVLAYGYRVIVSNNTIDRCADIHPTTHDSEAIYLKAVLLTVESNIVQDGGRGDGNITVKGYPFDGEPEDVPGSNHSKYVIVSGNIVTNSDDYVAAYSRPFAGIYAWGSRVDTKNNSISGKYSRGIAAYGSGQISSNTLSVDSDYGILYSPSDATDQTFIKITDNFVESLGVTSAGISARLATTTAMALPVTQIDNNVVRLGSAATVTGEATGISVRADRVASGNNTFNFVQVNNNSVQGRSGINFSAISLITNNGTGNNGAITTAHLIGNSARLPLYGVSITGTAGDIGYLHVADSTFNGTIVSAFNNPNLPTTTKISNIRGNRVTTNAGTATITAAATEVTVTMGISDTNLRPTTLDLISVCPTNNLGTATKWWVDSLSGDTFKIKVDAAPGASTAIFAWKVNNQYY